MKPLARWHIGNVSKQGFECLHHSIRSFKKFYDVEVIVCFNCRKEDLEIDENLFDQNPYRSDAITPTGVAWKLYPPRLDLSRKEIVIDNDIVFEERIPEIDQFLESDCTLLSEDVSRSYGKFERHVPKGYCINSGLYGMPERFDFKNYIDFYVKEQWEINATAQYTASQTFDEQGIVAIALLDYSKFVIIPETSLRNCEQKLRKGKALHFIGVNRTYYHRAFQLYKFEKTKRF